MKCMMPGCEREAPNNFGVRLRKRGKKYNAIWAQNTTANLCDEHARQGFKVMVKLEPVAEQVVESEVTTAGSIPFRRRTRINAAKLP